MAEISKETQEKLGFGKPLPSPFVSRMSENSLEAMKRQEEISNEQTDFSTLYSKAREEENKTKRKRMKAQK